MQYLRILLLALFIPINGYAVQVFDDQEVQDVLSKFTTPIFKYSDLPDIKMIFINQEEVNAFVANTRNIFIYSGMITLSKNPEVLAGVIAHECGHMNLNHLSVMGPKSRESFGVAATGFLIGAAAALLTGDPSTIAAGGMAGTESAVKHALSYSRLNEQQADSFALKALDKVGISKNGILEFFQVTEKNQRALIADVNKYLLTHPLSKDRLEYVKHSTLAQSNKLFNAEYRQQYAMMVAKISAFTMPYSETIKKYNNSSKESLYANSIASFKQGNIKKALSLIDKLIQLEPNNPYFIELKGQFLFESGDVKNSINFYEKALKIKPTSNLFKLELAYALVVNNTKLDYAIKSLNEITEEERDNFAAWHALGIAYGKAGEKPKEYIALAKAFSISKKKELSKKFLNSYEKNPSDLDNNLQTALDELKA